METKKLGKECFVVDAVMEIIKTLYHRGYEGGTTLSEVGRKYLPYDERYRIGYQPYELKNYGISRKTKWTALKNLEKADYIYLHGKQWKPSKGLMELSTGLEEMFTRNLKKQIEQYEITIKRLEKQVNLLQVEKDG